MSATLGKKKVGGNLQGKSQWNWEQKPGCFGEQVVFVETEADSADNSFKKCFGSGGAEASC